MESRLCCPLLRCPKTNSAARALCKPTANPPAKLHKEKRVEWSRCQGVIHMDIRADVEDGEAEIEHLNSASDCSCVCAVRAKKNGAGRSPRHRIKMSPRSHRSPRSCQPKVTATLSSNSGRRPLLDHQFSREFLSGCREYA